MTQRNRAFVEAMSARGTDVLLLDNNNDKVGDARWTPSRSRQAHAVYLGRRGQFRTIALDFDAKKSPAGPMGAVSDARIALDLLGAAGIEAVMVASGSAGGRHVIFTVAGPGVSASTADQLARRLAALGLSSLDLSNLTNATAGAIRVPLSPRSNGGGRARVLAGERIALEVLRRGTPPEAVSRLADALAGPGDRQHRLNREPGDDQEGGAETDDQSEKVYASGSEELMALACRLVNAGASRATFESVTQGLDPRSRPARHLDLPENRRRAVMDRTWTAARARVATHPAKFASTVSDVSVIADWQVADVGRLAGSTGRVALVLRREAVSRGRRLIALSVRQASEQAGIGKSAAARALRELVEHGLLEVAGDHTAMHGTRYRLQPLVCWSSDVRRTVVPFCLVGGVREQTVHRMSAADNEALALAEDTTAEVWSQAGLGDARRRVYYVLAGALLGPGDVHVDAIAAEVGSHPRTVNRHLAVLAAHRLAHKVGPALWTAEVRPADDLASELGVAGVNAQRVDVNARDRLEDRVRRVKHRLAARGAQPVRQRAYVPGMRWDVLDEAVDCKPFSTPLLAPRLDRDGAPTSTMRAVT